MRKIRLFIERNSLKDSDLIEIQNQDFIYLSKVMRVKIEDKIEVFNGFDGDFLAKIIQINKRSIQIEVLNKLKEQESSNNITLAFAPVKNIGIDFIAKKATELGINKFQPIITKHTIVNKINYDRFKANIKEACEQCERNSIPEIIEISKLNKFLEKDLENKILILCDESENGKKASQILPKIAKNRTNNPEIIIFIGPEGGFSEEEFQTFYKIENLNSITLGKRILRADTAMISALTLVNEFID